MVYFAVGLFFDRQQTRVYPATHRGQVLVSPRKLRRTELHVHAALALLARVSRTRCPLKHAKMALSGYETRNRSSIPPVWESPKLDKIFHRLAPNGKQTSRQQARPSNEAIINGQLIKRHNHHQEHRLDRWHCLKHREKQEVNTCHRNRLTDASIAKYHV